MINAFVVSFPLNLEHSEYSGSYRVPPYMYAFLTEISIYLSNKLFHEFDLKLKLNLHSLYT